MSVSWRFIVAATAMAVAATCFGQDRFPDVPENHWAYEALAKMQAEGLLVGYPDGRFRGSRPVTRYEMASAIYDVYANLKKLMDEPLAKIKGWLDNVPTIPKETADMVSDIEATVNSMKGWAADIANLKRASDTFELELEQLGVNVEAMRKDLGGLEGRVGKLEQRKSAVDVHGDINYWMGNGQSESGLYGLNKDGRIVGTTTPGNITSFYPPVSNSASLAEDMTMLHEAAFSFSGTNTKGPQWTGTVVVTDMFGNPNNNPATVAFGNQSDMFNSAYGMADVSALGMQGYAPGQEDIYVQNFGMKFGNDKLGAEVGRVAYSVNPYMFQRIDNSSYYSNSRWDNGLYYFDGGIFHAAFGPVKLEGFAGQNSGLLSAQGVELNPVRTGPLDGPFTGGPDVASGQRFDVDGSAGLNAKIATGKFGSIGLAYLDFDSRTDTQINLGINENRLVVYGTDEDFHIGQLALSGGYHKSELKDDNTAVNTNADYAWNARMEYKGGPFDFYGEYRQVAANYLAPGDWGRLGVIRNPTNIKGARVGGSIQLGRHFTLSGTGEFEAGLSNDFQASTFLGESTNINGYQAQLDYRPKKDLDFFGAYEATRFGQIADPMDLLAGSGNPNYRWTTFGFGYGINQNTKLTIQYELSDVINDYQVSFGSDFRGGWLTTQLSLKF